jgi:hypothetical protein
MGRWSLRTTIGLDAGGDVEEAERLDEVIDGGLACTGARLFGRGAIGIATSRILLYAG